MALSQTSLSHMISDLMLLQPVILGSQNVMNAVDGATIERRIRISQLDEGSARCKVSRAWDPRKDFSQPTQPPITPSTSSAILPQQERTEPSGHRPCRHGVKSSLRREPDVPGDLLRAIFGNVTMPENPFSLGNKRQRYALEIVARHEDPPCVALLCYLS